MNTRRSGLYCFFVVLLGIALCGCEKKADVPALTGTLQLLFEARAGSELLVPGTGVYRNGGNEPFTVKEFDFFISNIQLTTARGGVFSVPKDSSYFLISTANGSTTALLRNLPAGAYTGVTFTLGIDSLKSTAPLEQRTGVLDPAGAAAGMYWTWNSGYIFLKLEGTSPVAATPENRFVYHIGGFGGYNTPTINNLRKIHLEAPAGGAAAVAEGSMPQMIITADVLKIFDAVKPVRIAQNPTVMFNPASVDLADNYQHLFTLQSIRN